ncbi:MAG TPA: helix-turn-helix transcriptional regulator [Xanthobacteraceae bacterium]|nr:helix-turn-helix transcriptional regulator [Xanthobacteraceae bacterium]
MKPTPRNSKPTAATTDTSAYLRRLGERVRTMRHRRGMVRKALAKKAGISERYIAQLESGQGNCSIVLLRRIARALGVALEDLVYDRPDRPVEALLVAQMLERLPASAIEEARQLLQQRFGAALAEHKRERIALIGLRGGGKSTLGRLLAGARGLPFIELDREVERLSGSTLHEIFELFGQERFRRLEREALEKVLSEREKFVLATSGSLVTEPATYERLLDACFTVWVRAEPEEHMQRVIAQGDLRPMRDSSRAMADLLAILRSREPLYAKADATVVTTGKSPQESITELLRLLNMAGSSDAPKQARMPAS